MTANFNSMNARETRVGDPLHTGSSGACDERRRRPLMWVALGVALTVCAALGLGTHVPAAAQTPELGAEMSIAAGTALQPRTNFAPGMATSLPDSAMSLPSQPGFLATLLENGCPECQGAISDLRSQRLVLFKLQLLFIAVLETQIELENARAEAEAQLAKARKTGIGIKAAEDELSRIEASIQSLQTYADAIKKRLEDQEDAVQDATIVVLDCLERCKKRVMSGNGVALASITGDDLGFDAVLGRMFSDGDAVVIRVDVNGDGQRDQLSVESNGDVVLRTSEVGELGAGQVVANNIGNAIITIDESADSGLPSLGISDARTGVTELLEEFGADGFEVVDIQRRIGEAVGLSVDPLIGEVIIVDGQADEELESLESPRLLDSQLRASPVDRTAQDFGADVLQSFDVSRSGVELSVDPDGAQ